MEGGHRASGGNNTVYINVILSLNIPNGAQDVDFTPDVGNNLVNPTYK